MSRAISWRGPSWAACPIRLAGEASRCRQSPWPAPVTRLVDMADFDSHPLLISDTLAVWDVSCPGTCKHRSAEECVSTTHLVFPYRGVYVRNVGRAETVAEANQVVFFNEDEPYQVSHPVEGGDSSLSIGISAATLLELTPAGYLHVKDRATFNRSHLRIDARTQALMSLLRHRLDRGTIETLEAETLTLTMVRRALDERTWHTAAGRVGRQKLVDRAKLVLSSDLGRRWTLAEIAGSVGVSPVYLTQVFQQVEGIPLYRYQLQLRLARAVDLLGGHSNLTYLALDLGFSSYSHFSSAFKKAYGLTPLEFQRSARVR
jgi:AraC family transcriptional regulator